MSGGSKLTTFFSKGTIAPFLGRLDPSNSDHSTLFLDRADEMENTKRLLRVQYNTQPDKIRLLAGPPGCGKTTFMKFLDKEIPNSHYISLNDMTPFGNKRLSVDDYVTLFAKLELLIDYEAKGGNVPFDLESDFLETGIWRKYIQNRSFDFSLHQIAIKEFLQSVLNKLDNSKSKRFKEPIYLLIDNVDLIHVSDQHLILFILSYVVNNTNAVEVVYSTRPHGVAISNSMPREKEGRETTELITLKKLDVTKVISSRFEHEKNGIELSDFMTVESRELLEALSDSNVPLGFDIVSRVLNTSQDFNLPLQKDKLVKFCLGNERSSTLLPDIFSFHDYNLGKVPVAYAMLLALKSPSWINADFQDQYTELLKELSGRNRKRVTKASINKILNKCRHSRLVRRIGVMSKDVIQNNLQTGDDLFGFKVALTSRGKSILEEICMMEEYQSWSCFEKLPFGVQRKIKAASIIGAISSDARTNWLHGSNGK
ncbi:MAG: ATP-binding protein [Litorimonas sp.]